MLMIRITEIVQVYPARYFHSRHVSHDMSVTLLCQSRTSEIEEVDEADEQRDEEHGYCKSEQQLLHNHADRQRMISGAAI